MMSFLTPTPKTATQVGLGTLLAGGVFGALAVTSALLASKILASGQKSWFGLPKVTTFTVTTDRLLTPWQLRMIKGAQFFSLGAIGISGTLLSVSFGANLYSYLRAEEIKNNITGIFRNP